MEKRIRVEKDQRYGQQHRQWIAYVDGNLLLQKCGNKERRFGSASSAKNAAEEHLRITA